MGMRMKIINNKRHAIYIADTTKEFNKLTHKKSYLKKGDIIIWNEEET